jgi:hypothetical protein
MTRGQEMIRTQPGLAFVNKAATYPRGFPLQADFKLGRKRFDHGKEPSLHVVSC